jgi:4,5:9,10-diseco-3-hydroxy-5,9,17-trioxoandrosta-1(10),2-diene-4-oate hydrolase
MVEKFVNVEGLKTRYLEEGSGRPVLLLHGASLGSSADVFERNLAPLAAYGLRVIAFDQPGFGLTDNPKDYSVAYRRRFIAQFMDALGIKKASLVGHSQAGNMALGLAFDQTDRVSKVVVLATGSVLPPLPQGAKSGGGEGEEGGTSEPTLEDSRALLESNLFDRSLITPQVLQQRHRMSVGKNFQAFLERGKTPRGGGKDATPIWERLHQLPVPLLMIYGKQDRGSAGERAAALKERYPALNIHLLDGAKHLAQWDRAEEFVSLTAQFLTS